MNKVEITRKQKSSLRWVMVSAIVFALSVGKFIEYILTNELRWDF
jgi:hypothetical protein